MCECKTQTITKQFFIVKDHSSDNTTSNQRSWQQNRISSTSYIRPIRTYQTYDIISSSNSGIKKSTSIDTSTSTASKNATSTSNTTTQSSRNNFQMYIKKKDEETDFAYINDMIFDECLNEKKFQLI